MDKLVAGNKMVTEHSGTQGLPCRGIVDGFASTVQILAEWSPFQCSNLFLKADSGEFGINLTKQGRILNVI